MSLQPWYKVVVPRQDLREGRPLEGFLDGQAECTGQNPDTGEADPAPVWIPARPARSRDEYGLGAGGVARGGLGDMNLNL